MRIACSTSFTKEPLESALAEIHEMGFQYVDLICIGGWNHILAPTLVDSFDQEMLRIENALTASQLIPIATNMAIDPPPHRRDPSTNALRSQRVNALLDMMQRLGIQRGGFYPGYRPEPAEWPQRIDDCAASFAEIVGAGKQRGLTVGPELHFATVVETLPQADALFERLPNLTITYDPSHFILRGHAVEETFHLLRRAHHVHLRGCLPDRIQTDMETGGGHIRQVVSALQENGYSGDISIEYLPNADFDSRKAIRQLKSMLEAIISG